MTHLTVTRRGFERSTLVQRGTVTVAEVFTDREPGDQYETAALFAAAPGLLAALRIARDHVRAAAEYDGAAADRALREGMHGTAHECRKQQDMRQCALRVIDEAIDNATS